MEDNGDLFGNPFMPFGPDTVVIRTNSTKNMMAYTISFDWFLRVENEFKNAKIGEVYVVNKRTIEGVNQYYTTTRAATEWGWVRKQAIFKENEPNPWPFGTDVSEYFD